MSAKHFVESIVRYPVKSMQGEPCESVWLGAAGIPGDRAWALRDEVRGGLRGAKKIPALMQLAARYLEEPREGAVPPPEISLPGGEAFLADDASASGRVSEAVGHAVSLWPLLPAEAQDHYRRGAPDDPDFEVEMRALFGRTADEPLPDFTKFPTELFEFESIPGTYFDAFPLLLLTRRSLDTLAARAPDSKIDVRRFRPNLLIAGGDPAEFPEIAWVGKRVAIGEAELAITVDCPRCVMTTHGFADLPRDTQIMRSLVREAGGSLGVYASVETPGNIRVGDEVRVLG
ncbi:MAG: MOSC domain-containing protein [Myxococcota bacterium]